MNIYIGSLPPKTSTRDINTYFSSFVTIIDIKRMKNKGRKSPGYIILKVSTEDEFNLLLSQEHYIGNQKVIVKPYLTPKQRLSLETSMLDKRVYIKSLPASMDQEVLRQLFTKYGEITSIILKKKQKSNITYAFITFLYASSASRCLEEGFVEFEDKILEIKDYKINKSKFEKEIREKQNLQNQDQLIRLNLNQGHCQRLISRYQNHERIMAEGLGPVIYQLTSGQPPGSRNIERSSPSPPVYQYRKWASVKLVSTCYPKPSFKVDDYSNLEKIIIGSLAKKESCISRRHGQFNFRFNK